MARKFIDLDEAAKMLGVTPDTLTEMRERQKIYGYRDGGSWKFKPEDVEKLVADREAIEQEGEFAELDEDPDSILLSEVELGQSDESTSSTIIGGKPNRIDSLESDIQLAQPKHDSDLNLDSAISSDGKRGSDVLEGGSGVSPMFDELDTLDLEMPSAADSGITSGLANKKDVLAGDPGTSEISLGSDALKFEGSGLAFGSEDELALGEASDAEIAESVEGGSAIDLTGDEDGDLVLGGSSHGDLSRAGDSGINLLNPADSGLSLESSPLQLGGSAVESLELGEDDMLLADEPAAKGGAAAAKKAAPAESDDDFLLAPLEEAGAEESDSGSQVIALDSEVEFEEAAPGMSAISAATEEATSGLLEEDLDAGLGAAALGTAALTPAAAATMAAAAPTPGALAAPEAVFSGWNIASLALCAVLLMFCGMFAFDMLRNMWSWGGAYSVNSPMMDMVLGMFGK
jgi:excisionase family DNA binding protein